MKFTKPNQILLITALLIVPVTVAYLADNYFRNSSKDVISQNIEEKEIGAVAGMSDDKVEDITDKFPLMPGSEIISVDTSNENTYITLESSKSEQEIKDFYKNQTDTNNNKLEISISGNIIKITLKD
ncbi:hypothetical protein A2713_02250 [candidate division WWE3 bacterium RIFCSPHIGHO2_01_FULL_35_17]|uniref:Uncharacterized protein n=1 Tax=candidate division WWE3 bacterium RIFCSPHIGHO2_01_FULL_35_17 TaxID=1802614 RepID=A0A1F4UNX4_UNCKA|nr:MAG: hypothetical protein A2713_02250 [candidate division WWE3 bacterium RIFCSPHIGHO2_01_FULL_35_17]